MNGVPRAQEWIDQCETLTELAGVGHFLPSEAPQAVAAAVRKR